MPSVDFKTDGPVDLGDFLTVLKVAAHRSTRSAIARERIVAIFPQNLDTDVESVLRKIRQDLLDSVGKNRVLHEATSKATLKVVYAGNEFFHEDQPARVLGGRQLLTARVSRRKACTTP